LRSGEVNLRTGPGIRYPIDWVYKRRGLPVEVINEFESWRRIRDWQGAVGWVHRSMLQGSRTVLVTAGTHRALRQDPDERSRSLAYVEPGVIGTLEACEDVWCEVDIAGFRGWLRRDHLYGIYPHESVP
jgi:SH3-like domain-containing protein